MALRLVAAHLVREREREKSTAAPRTTAKTSGVFPARESCALVRLCCEDLAPNSQIVIDILQFGNLGMEF